MILILIIVIGIWIIGNALLILLIYTMYRRDRECCNLKKIKAYLKHQILTQDPSKTNVFKDILKQITEDE